MDVCGVIFPTVSDLCSIKHFYSVVEIIPIHYLLWAIFTGCVFSVALCVFKLHLFLVYYMVCRNSIEHVHVTNTYLLSFEGSLVCVVKYCPTFNTCEWKCDPSVISLTSTMCHWISWIWTSWLFCAVICYLDRCDRSVSINTSVERRFSGFGLDITSVRYLRPVLQLFLYFEIGIYTYH